MTWKVNFDTSFNQTIYLNCINSVDVFSKCYSFRVCFCCQVPLCIQSVALPSLAVPATCAVVEHCVQQWRNVCVPTQGTTVEFWQCSLMPVYIFCNTLACLSCCATKLMVVRSELRNFTIGVVFDCNTLQWCWILVLVLVSRPNFAVLVLVLILTCLVLFNNVLWINFVTKLQKKLIHYKSTMRFFRRMLLISYFTQYYFVK